MILETIKPKYIIKDYYYDKWKLKFGILPPSPIDLGIIEPITHELSHVYFTIGRFWPNYTHDFEYMEDVVSKILSDKIKSETLSDLNEFKSLVVGIISSLYFEDIDFYALLKYAVQNNLCNKYYHDFSKSYLIIQQFAELKSTQKIANDLVKFLISVGENNDGR